VQTLSADVLEKHTDVQLLTQSADTLTRDCLSDQATVIREPVGDVSHRWDALSHGVTDRMVRLDNLQSFT